MVVATVVGTAIAIGALAYLAARRWPRAAVAPRVSTAQIQEAVPHHTGLQRVLRSRLDAAPVTGFALTAAVALILVGVVGIGLLFAMVRTHTGFAEWDQTFAEFGADHSGPGSTQFLRDVSVIGGTTGAFLIAAVVAAFEFRRTRSWAVLGFLALVAVGQFLLANLVKLVVDRARPDLLQLTGFSGPSFPSGHATAAAATLMACAFLIGRGRSLHTKAVLAGLAAGLAGAVAATRVLLGVHWFTDVLAGLLLGWLWFAACSIAFGGRFLRFGAPVEQAEEAARDPVSPGR